MNSSARLDPLALLRQQEGQRLPWLVPERHRRMAESPFAFFRGAAIVMAADLGRQPHSGLMVQLCGDAHLLNFGFYGSPERQLLFGINDFDETHPGPFEWDVQRLAASFDQALDGPMAAMPAKIVCDVSAFQRRQAYDDDVCVLVVEAVSS